MTSGFTNAVTSDGSVTIKGSGTLNATGATNGIQADYTVSITDGATVNAIGTSGMGIFISYAWNYLDGLRIESDAASVTISGTTYGVGYANTSTLAPPEINSLNVTVTGGTAAFQVAPALNGVGAKASGNINGTASETYVSANLSNYKWFQSEALSSVSVTVSSVTNYNLWVGGVQVTSDNAADVLSDGKVSYDHNTKTLTLNNATITNWHEYGNNDRSGIYCEGDLFINLVGNNKVIQQTVATNNMEIGCSSYAVYINDHMGSGGNLTFTGTGSLTAASANTNAGYTNSWSVAIYTFGIVKVLDNCTITAYCGKSTRAEAAIYTDTLTLPEGMVAVGNRIAYDDSALGAVRGRNNDYKYVEIAPGYTVTLNTVFGTINSGNVSYYFVGEGATLPTDVTKTGKTFAGWYDNAVCTGDAVTSIAANATGAKEYWAKWTEDDSAISVTGVTLNKATLAFTEGDSSTLTATVAPDNATNKTVTWTSSNPAVATVDANGKVTAVAAGTATITATTEDGGKTATCAVTVSHDYTAQTKKAEALKTAGNCRDYAVYYYSCSACGKVENNDSHTFNGDKVKTAAHKDENKDGKCDVCAYDVGVPTTPTDPSKPSDDVQSPQTGDNSNISALFALMLGSLAAMCVILFCTKKKRHAENK